MTTSSRERRGAGALEFALTLPILLIVAFGIAELGLLMHRNHVVTRSARDGARIASGVIEGPDATGDQITAAAEQATRFALATAGVECSIDDACRVRADWVERDGWMTVQVSAQVSYDPLTMLLRPVMPETVHGGFVMLTQQQIIETP